MNRKLFLILTAILSVLIFTACTIALPEATTMQAEADVAQGEVPAEESSTEAETLTGEPATYTVDAETSELIWTGSNIVGHEQMGNIAISQGMLEFVGTTLTGGNVTIDMATMSSTSMSGDDANELIGHLMSDDFFAVPTYPTSELTFKSAQPTDVVDQYLVTADLTIRENTDELIFIADVTVEDGMIMATADIEFDRTQWGVIYGSGSFFDGLGDRVIRDEVTVQVTLVASNWG